MTTPRIKELVEEFESKYPRLWQSNSADDITIVSVEKEILDWLHTALTQAHQAGIDEAVEIIKSKRKTKNSIKHFGGMGYYNQQGYNQALDDTIKALKDNK